MTDFNVISPASVKSSALETTLRSTTPKDTADLNTSTVVQNAEQAERETKKAESLEGSGLKSIVSNQDEGRTDNQQALAQKVDELNQKLDELKNYLRFEMDDDTEKMVVFIRNSETDEVIRQIPSEQFLTISKSITEFLERRQSSFEDFQFPKGLFTDERV